MKCELLRRVQNLKTSENALVIWIGQMNANSEKSDEVIKESRYLDRS